MSRHLLPGQLHPDLACAIALGIVEDPRVVVSLEAVTVHDASMHPLGTVHNWLAGNDPLDVVTRDYLNAKRQAIMSTMHRSGQNAWGAASAVRKRDSANQTARQARDQARTLLAERGTLAHARSIGLKLICLE